MSPILVGDLSVVDPVALVELPDELDHMFHAHARDGRPRGCVRVLVGGGGVRWASRPSQQLLLRDDAEQASGSQRGISGIAICDCDACKQRVSTAFVRANRNRGRADSAKARECTRICAQRGFRAAAAYQADRSLARSCHLHPPAKDTHSINLACARSPPRERARAPSHVRQTPRQVAQARNLTCAGLW